MLNQLANGNQYTSQGQTFTNPNYMQAMMHQGLQYSNPNSLNLNNMHSHSNPSQNQNQASTTDPDGNFKRGLEADNDNEDSDGAPLSSSKATKEDRRKIKIEYIQDKSRRHITFSKRKAGIMKKAFELSTLTGTQILLLVVSETGLVYTFTTPKLQPLVTKPEGKNLIQSCLNAPDPQLLHQLEVQRMNAVTPNLSQLNPTNGNPQFSAAYSDMLPSEPSLPPTYEPKPANGQTSNPNLQSSNSTTPQQHFNLYAMSTNLNNFNYMNSCDLRFSNPTLQHSLHTTTTSPSMLNSPTLHMNLNDNSNSNGNNNAPQNGFNKYWQQLPSNLQSPSLPNMNGTKLEKSPDL